VITRRLPPDCSDYVDAYLTTESPQNRVYLPPWSDVDAVLELFRYEDLSEWAWEWPWLDEEPSPLEALEAAIKRAEEGNPSDLIRIATDVIHITTQKRKRGRPKGKMSEAKRERTWPIHRAASMVPFAEAILRDMYPDQPTSQILDRALLVIEYICQREDVTPDKLANYLARPKGNRRHINKPSEPSETSDTSKTPRASKT
jgi:hypothetical protein